MKRVAVVGSAGQLGTDLVSHLERTGAYQVFPLRHSDIECSDPAAVRRVLGSCAPDVVVNCAAFVRVDDCEDRQEEAFRVNASGARFVAEACATLDATCVYISTDYVFDGQNSTPYLEEAPTHPLSIYGLSKEAGEQSVRTTLEKHHIVRCSGLFGVAGASGKGGNFITTMLQLAREGRDIRVVDDQRFSPTATDILARKIAWLMTVEEYGTWHITCQGDCTWYELADTTFGLLDLHPKLTPISSAAFGAKARRPLYSVLGHGRLKRAGEDGLPYWKDSLEQYLRAKGEISGASYA